MAASIFTCLNHGPALSRDFVKTQFQQGKSRGPDFSKFGAVGIQIYMGSHHNLKRELKDDDIDIPYSAGGDIRVIYSGTFTNLSELNEQDEDPTSILIQLYRDYGFEQMLVLLKGEFSLILLDQSMSVENCILYVARDAFGIAPLYISDFENQLPIAFASERSMLEGFYSDSSPRQVEPGTYSIYQLTNGVYQTWTPVKTDIRYYTLPLPKRVLNSGSDSMHMNFMTHIVDAVGPSFNGDSVACLVSGGLKSAVVASILAKKLDGKSQLKTYFVGFTNDPMLLPRGYKKAESVARYIGSDHTAILLSRFDYEDALEEVRDRFGSEMDKEECKNAAVFFAGAKWLRDRTTVKTVYLGTGMDELVGPNAEPDPIEYDKKARDGLRRFPYKAGLTVDRCFGTFGIDIQMPFLNRDLVDFYFRLPVSLRMESRENVETSFSLSITNPFLDKYLNWDIVKCKAKSPLKSAFSRFL